jgi:hypothetical protein
VPRRRSQCLNQLVPLVEGELRRIAHFYMRMERHGHTLQTTALINEAYLKLVNQAQTDWQNRAQFLGVAARLMRHTRPLRSCARCIPERREMRPVELRIPRISGRLRPPCGVQFPRGARRNPGTWTSGTHRDRGKRLAICQVAAKSSDAGFREMTPGKSASILRAERR